MILGIRQLIENPAICSQPFAPLISLPKHNQQQNRQTAMAAMIKRWFFKTSVFIL